jgi:hypothetical protein
MLLLLFAKFGMVFNVLTGPPADYASIVSTQSALKMCQLEYKSEALLSYLKTGMNEISEKGLKKAFEQLGSSKAAERKAAAQILIKAGLKSIPYLKKGLSSSDPEIKDASKALSLQIQQSSSKKNAADFVKKLYAIRALGELKAGKAQGLLGIYSSSSNVSLAEEARQALAACGGPAYHRRTGLEAIKELQKMIPSGAGFAGVWDLERTSKKEYLNFLTEVLAKDMGSGNPFTKFININKAKFLPAIQFGLNMTGNIRVDAVAAYLAADIGQNEGYLGFVVKGKFDSSRLYTLMAPMGFQEQEYRGVKILFQHEISMSFIDDDTFIWAVGDNRQGEYIKPFIDSALDKKSTPSNSLKPAFDMVLEGKVRLAISGHFGARTIATIDKELGRELERLRGRNRPLDIIELNAMNLFVNWSTSKQSVAWLGENLDIHVKCEVPNDAVAAEVAGNLEFLDSGMRNLINEQIMKSISRRPNAVMILMSLQNFDLDKAFGKIKQKSTEVSVIVSVKQILNVFPMAALFF